MKINLIPLVFLVFSYFSCVLFLFSFENIVIHFVTVLAIRLEPGLDEVFYSLYELRMVFMKLAI